MKEVIEMFDKLCTRYSPEIAIELIKIYYLKDLNSKKEKEIEEINVIAYQVSFLADCISEVQEQSERQNEILVEIGNTFLRRY